MEKIRWKNKERRKNPDKKIFAENMDKCKECGKGIDFNNYNRSEYVYKKKVGDSTSYFCSWTCMRKRERK